MSKTNSVTEAWEKYRSFLQSRFAQSSRAKQEILISRFVQVIVIGMTIFVIRLFFAQLNSFVGVVFLPVALLAAWFVSAKILAPNIVLKCDRFLNRE